MLVVCALACGDDANTIGSFAPTTKETVLVNGSLQESEHPRHSENFKVTIDVPHRYRRAPSFEDPQWSLDAKSNGTYLGLSIQREFDRRHMSKCVGFGDQFRWIDLPDGFIESCQRIPARRVLISNGIALECMFTTETPFPPARIEEAWKICEAIQATPCKWAGLEKDEAPYSPYATATCNDGTTFKDREFTRYRRRYIEEDERKRQVTR